MEFKERSDVVKVTADVEQELGGLVADLGISTVQTTRDLLLRFFGKGGWEELYHALKQRNR